MKNRADKLFKNIKNKKEVLNLHIDEIYCGDLIYDSYIRFRNKPTVDINDLFLKKLIYLSILSIKCLRDYKINISLNICLLLSQLIFIMDY